MRILLSPQRSGTPRPALSVSGSVLTVNGEALDFAQLAADGDLIEGSAIVNAYALGARNVEGTIEVTVLLPVGDSPTVAEAYPVPITVSEGEVRLP